MRAIVRYSEGLRCGFEFLVVTDEQQETLRQVCVVLANVPDLAVFLYKSLQPSITPVTIEPCQARYHRTIDGCTLGKDCMGEKVAPAAASTELLRVKALREASEHGRSLRPDPAHP